MPVTHCELCDLPKAQCIHGSAEGKRKVQGKKKPKQPKAVASVGFPQRPEKCTRCRRKPPQGRYWMCAACLLKTGATKCTQCKKPFKPEDGYTAKKPKCRSCRTRGNGSVWSVASAGSPSLGKQR